MVKVYTMGVPRGSPGVHGGVEESGPKCFCAWRTKHEFFFVVWGSGEVRRWPWRFLEMPIVISIVSSASRWGGKIPCATRWPGSHGTKVPSGTARYTWNGDIILQANAGPDWCTGHALYRLVRQPVLAISWWSRIGCTHACLRLCCLFFLRV